MKVVVITAALPPLKSGGADFVQRLCSELASSGANVEVIGPANTRSEDPAVKLHHLEGKWNWRAAQRCITLCRQLKPDVVDVIFTGWIYNDHPMVTFLPTMIKKTCEGVRVVVHIESLGGIQRSKSNVVRASGRYIASWIVGRNELSYEYGALLRDSDAIITLSDRDREELMLRDRSVANKSHTIPPPPIMPIIPMLAEEEKVRQRAKLGVSDEDALLGFYGYVYPGKGIEVLFESIHSLRNRGRRLKLIIVGDKPEQYVLDREKVPDYLNDLKRLARRLKIDEHIIWSSYEPFGSEEPSRKLRLADIGVFPFRNGINLHNSSFWFAAAHGLPIVATRGSSTESVFINRENVLFAKPNDAEDLSQKITDLCIDPILRKTLGENVETLATSRFSWNTCIERTVAVLSGSDAQQPSGESNSVTVDS